MRRTTLLASLVISFAAGVGGAWHLKGPEAPAQFVASTGPRLPAIPRSSDIGTIRIKTSGKSFFARDPSGAFVPETRAGKQYFQVKEGTYSFERTLATDRTALIVMDPWEDSGSSFLNDYYAPVIRDKLMPLINRAIDLKIPVIVLTNAPASAAAYGSDVAPGIKRLADAGQVHIVHHQDTDRARFSAWLKSMSVDTLIYSGFASNMCVIGRDLGMIPMQVSGFRLFFVPEASAAVEFGDSWRTGSVHEATTSMISQWVGELIRLDDFLDASTKPTGRGLAPTKSIADSLSSAS